MVKRAPQAKKMGVSEAQTPDAFVRVMSMDITLNYFGHNFKSVLITFAVLSYFRKSRLDVTFVDFTFAVLSYFQKSRLDLSFMELSLTHIWN